MDNNQARIENPGINTPHKPGMCASGAWLAKLAGTYAPLAGLTRMNAPASLQSLAQDLHDSATPPAPLPTVVTPSGRFIYSHKDLIDYILANPTATREQIGARYGRSPSWVTMVTSSDAWRAAFAARRAEVVDPTLIASHEERYAAVASLSAERLLERLADKAKPMSDAMLCRAAEFGAKAVGAGGNAPTAAPTVRLEVLAERLKNFLPSDHPQGIIYENEISPRPDEVRPTGPVRGESAQEAVRSNAGGSGAPAEQDGRGLEVK